MLLESSSLIAAALFTGAAFYINAVEQPARLGLPAPAMLAQWKPAYARGLVMQVALVVAATLCGLASWWQGGGAGFLAGAALMAANVPATYALIMPVNRRLEAIPADAAGPDARALVERWGRLHAIRTALGLAATLAFALAGAGLDQ